MTKPRNQPRQPSFSYKQWVITAVGALLVSAVTSGVTFIIDMHDSTLLLEHRMSALEQQTNKQWTILSGKVDK